MKYLLATAIVLLSACVPPFDYATDLIPDLGFETVQQAATWVAWHVEYIDDQVTHQKNDEWQLPHQTYIWQTGDCEDHAALLVYILHEQMGIADVYAVYGRSGNSAHVWVLVGTDHWESTSGMRDNGLPARYPRQITMYDYEQLMGHARVRSIVSNH